MISLAKIKLLVRSLRLEYEDKLRQEKFEFKEAAEAEIEMVKFKIELKESTIMSFVGFLDAVGKDFEVVGKDVEKALSVVVKYAIPIETLVKMLFPQLAPEVMVAASAANLIQTAVIEVEQKYASIKASAGTGASKLADVLTLAEDTVTQLLAQAGIKADTTYITSLVNAVVAMLNVWNAPATSSTTIAAPSAVIISSTTTPVA